MKPIEAAMRASARTGFYFIPEDETRAIITAFLDAAAGDVKVALRVGKTPVHLRDADWGKAAILALKEAVG